MFGLFSNGRKLDAQAEIFLKVSRNHISRENKKMASCFTENANISCDTSTTKIGQIILA